MSKKTWIIFAAICIVLLGGLIVLSRKDQANVSSIDPNEIQPASASSGNIADHVKGLTDSKVVLIEYGDFQCPYCGQAYPKVKSIVNDYASKITFVFRNYPLASLHANARSAAAAAEAAGLQGKYWEMYNKLYETQNEWENASTDERTNKFVAYATAIGVANIDKFKTDMAGNDVNKKINFDFALGNKQKVTGTPSFFINGTKIDDEVSSSVISGDGSALRKALDSALNK